MARRFASYEEFLPYYVAMHRKQATRLLHTVGTLSGLTLALRGLSGGRVRAVLWLPLVGYGLAWPAHFLVERNNPATFGHPWWSLRGDAFMIGRILGGRDADLQDLADTWLREHAGEAGVPDPVRPPRVVELERVIELPT